MAPRIRWESINDCIISDGALRKLIKNSTVVLIVALCSYVKSHAYICTSFKWKKCSLENPKHSLIVENGLHKQVPVSLNLCNWTRNVDFQTLLFNSFCLSLCISEEICWRAVYNIRDSKKFFSTAILAHCKIFHAPYIWKNRLAASLLDYIIK